MRTPGTSGASHPSEEELCAFLRGRLPAARSAQVLHHWLGRCAHCQAAMDSALRSATAQDAAERYDESIERALAAAVREEYQERRRRLRVAEGVAVLRQGDEPQAQGTYSARERLEADLLHSKELRYTDPKAMLARIELAVMDAHLHLTAEACGGPALYQDFWCRLHVEYANALRINDRFLFAQEELGKAFKHSLLGTGDETLKAHLYRIQASLLGDRHSFELAQLVLDQSFEIYNRYSLAHLAGRVLVSKGRFYVEARQPQAAIAPLRRSFELLDPAIDPDLVLSARFNLASAMADGGEAREAKTVLWQLAQEFESRGQRLNSLRARWLEGKIHFTLGEAERAARDFEAVRQGFHEAEQHFDEGLVSLELAIVLRALRRRREARDLLAETRALFELLQIDGSVLLNIQIFEDIFRRRDSAARALFEMVATLRLAAAEAERQERQAVDRALREEGGYRRR